jgi:hypothetical protein
MTISSEQIKSTYIGDGSTKDFDFTFRVNSGSDIDLYLVDASSSPYSITELTSNFSVSAADGSYPSTGGTVHYPTTGDALTADYKLIIKRATPKTQESAYPYGNVLNPQHVERSLDTTCMQVQEISDGEKRAMKVDDVVDLSTIDLTLPTPVAGYGFIWNSTATKLVAAPIENVEDFAIAASNSANSASGSASAAASSANAASGSASAASSSADAASTSAGLAATSAQQAVESAAQSADNTRVRINSTAYPLGAISYTQTMAKSLWLKCTTAGTTDTIEPSGIASITESGTVTDGSVVWMAIQLAFLASPEFTGTPVSPTAGLGTNTTQLATTAFVKNQILDHVAGFIATTASDTTITISSNLFAEDTLDTTTVGAKGIDTGSLAASTKYYLYAIWGAAGYSFTLSASSSNPTLTTGYTQYKYMGMFLTNASTKLYRIKHIGRQAQYVIDGIVPIFLPALIYGVQGSTTTPTWISALWTGWAPTSATRLRLNLYYMGGTTAMAAPNTHYGVLTSTAIMPAYQGIYGNGIDSMSQFDLIPESNYVYFASNGSYNWLSITGWEENI